MLKSRTLLCGVLLGGALLSARWAEGQTPSQRPRPEGQDVQERAQGDNQNAPRDNSREREDRNQNSDDAKKGRTGGADDTKGDTRPDAESGTRRTNEANDNANRSRDDQRNETRRPSGEARDHGREADTNRGNERDREKSVVRPPREGDRSQTDGSDRDRDQTKDRDRGADFGASIDVQNDRLRISDVSRDSIAGRAGLQQGDVIFSVNGQRIDSRAAFDRYLYRSRVARVPIIVLRGNDRHTIYVDTGVFVLDNGRLDDRIAAAGAWLGVFLDHEQADRAVLRGIERNSPADRAGLRAGDVILRVDDAEVRSPVDLTLSIGERKAGDRVELGLGGQARDTITVTLGQRPDAAGDRYERSALPEPDGEDIDVSPRGVVDVDVYRGRRNDRRGRR